MFQIQINSARKFNNNKSARLRITPSILHSSNFHQNRIQYSDYKSMAAIISMAVHHANHERDTISPLLNKSDPNSEQDSK